MGRPTRSLIMARRANAALLAAIEAGNRTNTQFNEETFCLLLVNAWEILLKAYVVKQNRNRPNCIYKRDAKGKPIRAAYSQSFQTITFLEALSKANIPLNVKNNLQGMYAARNEISHLGILSTQLRESIFRYGSASVINFVKLLKDWFKVSAVVPYLLPIGFLGDAELLRQTRTDVKQRKLLEYLSQLLRESDQSDSAYSVSLHLEVSINPITSGGGTIGVTDDPNAPKVNLTDEEFLKAYPWTFKAMVSACRERFTDFSQNYSFKEYMRELKKDPNCAFERKHNPHKSKSPAIWFYKPYAVLGFFDTKYSKKK